jgi:hypothetical protein
MAVPGANIGDEYARTRKTTDEALLKLTHNMGELSRVISALLKQIETRVADDEEATKPTVAASIGD